METKYTPGRFDSDDEAHCGIQVCTLPASEGLYLTIAGLDSFKRFCPEHHREEAIAEQMYRVGL